ncbi:ParB/RepB/Spo0J family partition protein [bacterium]|nr:ParB/RepB/Spo0J family partition protein [bacterium]MBU1983689.1 ParB/RepB/Spo0J family partition protein [bacterium]
MKARKGLGKGLAALISEAEVPAEAGTLVTDIPVDRVDPNPFQPRQVFDEESIEELKQSIQAQGILQPVLVRRMDDRFQLIIGERRWRAARAAGLDSIPALIRDRASDEEMLELALLENVQREDLNPIELAQAIQSLQAKCSLTQEAVSQKLGVSRAHVANILRLLKLPKEIQAALAAGRITVGHARALLSVENPRRRDRLFRSFLADGRPTVREAEDLTRRAPKPRTGADLTADRQQQLALSKIEERLRLRFSTRIRIKPKGKGGVLEIQFFTSEDLERILEMIEG